MCYVILFKKNMNDLSMLVLIFEILFPYQNYFVYVKKSRVSKNPTNSFDICSENMPKIST